MYLLSRRRPTHLQFVQGPLTHSLTHSPPFLLSLIDRCIDFGVDCPIYLSIYPFPALQGAFVGSQVIWGPFADWLQVPKVQHPPLQDPYDGLDIIILTMVMILVLSLTNYIPVKYSTTRGQY